MLSTHDAAAKSCGDDVAGERIACSCGDTVISDTTLRPDDPVVRERCRGDGLIVVASELAETMTLHMDGLALIGTGVGRGIAVERGGSDGAVIVGGSVGRRGTVAGFGTGVEVRSGRALRRLESLELTGHRHEGLSISLAGTFVLDVRATRNGGDGIRAIGQGGRLLGVEAVENRAAGIRLISRYTVVDGRAERNGTHGFIVRGARNELGESFAARNEGFGFLVGGPSGGTARVGAEGNTRGGIGKAGSREGRPRGRQR